MRKLTCYAFYLTSATLCAACQEEDWLAAFENQPLHVRAIETTTGVAIDTNERSIDGSTFKLDDTPAFTIHATSGDRLQTGAEIVASVDPSFGLIVNQQPTAVTVQFDVSKQAACGSGCAQLYGAGLGVKLSGHLRPEGDRLRLDELTAAGETTPGVGLLADPRLDIVTLVVGP